MFQTTAFDLWRQEKQTRKLITLCSDLDKQLGGGIKLGNILEFCGGPGLGKTQFCLQLCVTVQFPSDCGGLGGKAIFIDTNQDFSIHRLKEISECMSSRFQKIFHGKTSSAAFSIESLMNRVSYIYCANYTQLLAHTILLQSTLQTDPEIKLIVIDSFSFLMRQIDEDVSERTRILYEILTRLRNLAIEFQLAIVITNELTSRFDGKDWNIYPALGNTHLHKINQRIILSKSMETGVRYAFLAKSVESPKIDIPYQIKSNGIRSLHS